MTRAGQARRLRRQQSEEENQLWKAFRAGRFAGFKWRRQHPLGTYHLDFYCPFARLAVELDGFTHGLPYPSAHDRARDTFLTEQGIKVIRIWNHQWRSNREGVLLAIWTALHERSGCTTVVRKPNNHQFVAPDPKKILVLKKPIHGCQSSDL